MKGSRLPARSVPDVIPGFSLEEPRQFVSMSDKWKFWQVRFSEILDAIGSD